MFPEICAVSRRIPWFLAGVCLLEFEQVASQVVGFCGEFLRNFLELCFKRIPGMCWLGGKSTWLTFSCSSVYLLRIYRFATANQPRTGSWWLRKSFADLIFPAERKIVSKTSPAVNIMIRVFRSQQIASDKKFVIVTSFFWFFSI